MLLLNIANWLKSFFKKLRILNVRSGKAVKWYWPVIVEGRGVIAIGDHSVLHRRVVLSAGAGGSITIGKHCMLGTESLLLAVNGKSIKLANNIGIGPRCSIMAHQDVTIENDVQFGAGCVVQSREQGHYGNFFVGHGTHIGDNSMLDITGNLTIGKEVALGPSCIIYTHDHDYKKSDLPRWKGGVHTAPVIIEDGTWIGAGVIILPGVRIGKGAVIAAGAVVTKNVEAECLYGGVPAQKLKLLSE